VQDEGRESKHVKRCGACKEVSGSLLGLNSPTLQLLNGVQVRYYGTACQRAHWPDHRKGSSRQFPQHPGGFSERFVNQLAMRRESSWN
jgi:hypothetical protein